MNNNSALKLLYGFTLATAIAGAQGAIVVNDTWIDGNRNDPPSPTYSENGTDTDADGNVESIWFASAFTNMNVVNPSPGVTPGVIRTIMPTNSYSWETYFTPEATPVTLANPGDQIKVTWAFRLTTVNTTDASQSFRVALADSPGTNRLTGNATTPGPGPYSGYAMFMNMSTTLSNANPFQLRERAAGDAGATNAFLSAGGGWTALTNSEILGVTGYAGGSTYTMIFSATRTDTGELEVAVSMTGGSIGGDDSLNVAYTDTTPNTFTFDMFAIRPSSAASTAGQFDTSLFRVEKFTTEQPILNIQRENTNVILNWSDSRYALLSATNVGGDFSTNATAASPYTNPIVGSQMFFRLVK